MTLRKKKNMYIARAASRVLGKELERIRINANDREECHNFQFRMNDNFLHEIFIEI